MRLLAIILSAVGTLAAQTPAPIDNGQVRVVVVTQEPHVKTQLHDHKMNRVMIYLDEGEQRLVYEDGKKVRLTWKAGDVKWSPASGMHTSEITSEKPVRIVEVELKKATSDVVRPRDITFDPVKTVSKLYKVEFENEFVRVVRVKLGPYIRVPLHEHPNRVVTYLTGQNFRVTTSDGKVTTQVREPGSVIWGTSVRHREENLEDKQFEAVVVEPKS